MLLLLSLMLLSASLAIADDTTYDLTFTDRELSGTWDAAAAVTILGQGTGCDISGKGAAFADGVLTISEAGVYVLSGEFTDMQLLIAAGSQDKVQIVLNGATLTSATGPVIYAKAADKVFLTAAQDTQNLIADGEDYAATDGETTLDAAIFSRADLCINGQGALTVMGNNHHGIASKDDLILTGLTLTVEAAATALDGKDCVMMHSLSATITAISNGIRSNNAEDEGRGYVYIKDSTLTITAGTDGIQAETLLEADNAVLTITTGEGSSDSTQRQSFPGGGRSGTDIFSNATTSTSASDGSWKALKAGQALVLNGGAYAIDSQDDCLHSNGTLTITDGIFTLSSGDDGIHADDEVNISGGVITISRSYEGIEASKIIISGGEIDITASDDGLNGAGGADGSAVADRWGRGRFGSSVGDITISGGYIHINAGGDGIDSNNTVTVRGGVTLVSCVNNSGNAAFDHDGTATVTGGILLATGGSGMAQSFDTAENQGCMLFSLNGQGGTSIAIVDANNRVVAAFTPDNSYSSVVVTAPSLAVGSTYTVVTGAEIDGTDAHGFASDVAFSGGATIGSIEMTTLLQGGSGHGMGGFSSGGGGFGGKPGGFEGEPGEMPEGEPGGFGGGGGQTPGGSRKPR